MQTDTVISERRERHSSPCFSAVSPGAISMEGYIPEHVLVYIQVNKSNRGIGIGKKMINFIKENCDGDIALHVEKDNPAVHLYKRLGFKIKYYEMRLLNK